MAKRRSSGEGSIYRTPDGTWRSQISIQGKRYSFNAANQRDCREWLRNTRNKQADGYDLNAGSISLRSFIANWLNTIKDARSAATVENYTWVLKPVLQRIGDMSLRDIQPDLLQSLYGRMISAGKSPHSVNRVHKVLHASFEYALKLKMIPSNPASSTTPPIPKQKEMSFLDEGQVQTLLLNAESFGDRYYPLYYLAIHTGMRQGELLGLKWDDLDWETQTIKVRRQLAYRPGGGHEFTAPKTSNGLRTVLLGVAAISVLRNCLKICNRMKVDKADLWNDLDLMFPSTVGSPIHPANLRRSFRKLLRLSGLPHVRFHDLRHTAASLMLNYGIPVIVASKRLGHAKPSITMDVYGHLIPSRQEEAAMLMDELLTPVGLPITPKLPR